MKVILTAVFALILCAFVPAKADCGPGEKEVFLPDWSCQWLPDGEFICSQSAYCVSACDPYECADEAKPVHKQPAKETPSPIIRIPIPVFLR
jgi:hypothetical protein